MGFLDSLGDAAKKLGNAVVAAPGAVYDMATYMAPGDQWGSADDNGFSGLLDSLGRRGTHLSLAVPAPVKTALGGTMHALNTAYHEGVDQPLSTLALMADSSGMLDNVFTADYGSLADSEKWAKAYEIAETQSFGHSLLTNADPVWNYGLPDSFEDKSDIDPLKAGPLPYQQGKWYKDHPTNFEFNAFGTDITTAWFLDPAVIVGKAAGSVRQTHVLGRIPDAAKPEFASRLDGSIVGADKTFGVAQNWNGRFESFFKYIGGENKLGRPLNAAEIRASSVELQKSGGGLAISSALEDALRLEDEADRMNAARRVFAVAAGDTTQIARLETEVAGAKALADKLRNIVNAKTVDLQAQALNRARTESPEFRALFDRQLANLDEAGDLSKFIKDWHAKVDADYNGLANLATTERTLDYLPGFHGGALGSEHKLAVAKGDDFLSKVEKKHDAAVAKITTLPKRDSYSSVYQQGLHSLPVMVMYPAKFMSALLPTKAVPAVVRGLRTVHYNGVINTHDWDAASDQLNSLMIHAGVNNETRLKHLSEVYGARNEIDKLAVIHRTEQVAVDGVIQQVVRKHGIDEAAAREFVQQIVVHGQNGRGGMLSAQNGSRIYGATKMPEQMAARTRSVANARTQAAWDTKRAAEMEKRGLDIGETSPLLQGDDWAPRVDQFIDSSGVPFTMPVVSSQLANRVPLIDIHLVKQSASDKAFAERLGRHAEAWRESSIEMSGLQAKLARATGSQAIRLQRQLENARKAQDALLTTATFLNRWWKVGVLFRLGYPMRVLADDHMRIAARIGYLPFLMANVGEGAKNAFYNHLPGFAAGSRRGVAKAEFELAKAKRQQLVAHFGRDRAHTTAEWDELQGLVRAHLGGAPAGESHLIEGNNAVAFRDGKPIAHLSWDKSTGEIENISVLPEYRRQGVASGLLKAARDAGHDVRHSQVRTEAGDAWARAVSDGPLPERKTVAQNFDGYHESVVADLRKALAPYAGRAPKMASGMTAKQIARMRELDPDGRVAEWHDLTSQARSLRASVATRTRNLAKMREEGADPAKIAASQAALDDAEGALRHVSDQLAGKIDPDELRSQIAAFDSSLQLGPKAYRGPKRAIGEANVKMGDGNEVAGAFAVRGYHEATSSNASFNMLLTDGEDMGYRMNQAGHWRSVAPGEPGYYNLWANILNHQFGHSPEFMSIIRREVKSTKDFKAWLSKPEQAHLRERMAFYAHDADDWGGRLLAMAEDYTGGMNDELLALMANGRVTARQLKRLFPEGSGRLPHLHGQLADVQSGRAGATRMLSDGIQKAFGYLAEMPTDRLSRHPFFNAVYKREVRAAYQVHVARKGADKFGDADRAAIEALARRKALKELKLTLWDISAHSHAAHTMRFLSPFFAAHQEALNRWWNIAKDDPSVARHFQMFFDNIRSTGLTYNDDTGEAVMPGEGIGGAGNKIMLKVPWADENNAVNKWLLKIGGDRYWSVNENGLNLILQNGILNPGVGPLVTIPVEELVRRYPEATEFEKVARALNQYPPAANNFKDLVIGQVAPAWSKRLMSYAQGEGSPEFGRYYMQNFADGLTTFRLQYDREPTELELKKLQDKANKETHLDLVLMALSNATSITPAKPMSKYAAVQNGLQKLYEQMRTEGHDMEWLRENFRKQYGDAYMAMIYSMGSNPAKLQGAVAEVSAIKKHSYLAKHIDPSLLRMAIGPEVEEADKAEQLYSSSAASWLSTQETGTPGENFRGKKDPREVATSLVVSQGWDMYDELVNALDVMADQQGLPGYESSPELVKMKRAGVDYIKAQNPVFAHSYDSYTQKSFDKLVDDMRLIVSNKTLANDPTRSDVYWLGQYIQLRDGVQDMLKQRAAAGGAKTMGAEDNADLARLYAAGLQYINQQSPYFKQFSYEGIIERDPLLVSAGVE